MGGGGVRVTEQGVGWLKAASVEERWRQDWQQHAGFGIQVFTSRVRCKMGGGRGRRWSQPPCPPHRPAGKKPF